MFNWSHYIFNIKINKGTITSDVWSLFGKYIKQTVFKPLDLNSAKPARVFPPQVI